MHRFAKADGLAQACAANALCPGSHGTNQATVFLVNCIGIGAACTSVEPDWLLFSPGFWALCFCVCLAALLAIVARSPAVWFALSVATFHTYCTDLKAAVTSSCFTIVTAQVAQTALPKRGTSFARCKSIAGGRSILGVPSAIHTCAIGLKHDKGLQVCPGPGGSSLTVPSEEAVAAGRAP